MLPRNRWDTSYTTGRGEYNDKYLWDPKKHTLGERNMTETKKKPPKKAVTPKEVVPKVTKVETQKPKPKKKAVPKVTKAMIGVGGGMLECGPFKVIISDGVMTETAEVKLSVVNLKNRICEIALVNSDNSEGVVSASKPIMVIVDSLGLTLKKGNRWVMMRLEPDQAIPTYSDPNAGWMSTKGPRKASIVIGLTTSFSKLMIVQV